MSERESRTVAPPGVVFAVMGGVLVGEAVLLFVSANWRAIPDGVKLAMIFGNLLAAYWLADRWRFSTRPRPSAASGMFLKGAIGYGAGVFLIGQIYNFHAEWRTGLLYWLAGTLPLAYAVDSRPVLGLALGTAVLWLAAGFGYWGDGFELLLSLLGAIFALCGLLHWGRQPFGRFAGTYFAAGACLVLGSTLLISDHEPSALQVSDARSFWHHLWWLTAICASLLAAGLFCLRSPSQRAQRWAAAFVPLALVPTFFLAARIDANAGAGQAFAVGASLLLLAECAGLVVFGSVTRARGPVKVGLVFFGILATWRFFDERWGYLPRAAMFAGVGLLLMMCGYWVERARRDGRLIRREVTP